MMTEYHTQLVKLFDQYLIKRRDVLATYAKKRGDNTSLVAAATHAVSNRLKEGDTLTSIARAIGRGLDPEAAQKAQVKLGGRYLNFLHINDLITITMARKDSDGQPCYFVEMTDTPEFVEHINESARAKRVANITTKPDAWHKPFNRGVPIVKRLNSDDADNYTQDKMPEVYKALNYLQSSEWEVNSDILTLMVEGLDGFSPEEVTEDEKSAALVSLSEKKRISLYIKEKQYLELLEKYSQQSARKWSKAEAEDYFQTKGFDYREVVSKHSVMQSFIKTVQFAADVEYETLYFQHNLDSRGRIYALSPYLSPQGNDAQKALLRFQKSGQMSLEWAYIHIANCAGQDKLSFEDRVQWTRDRLKEIVGVGLDPRSQQSFDFYDNIGIFSEKKTKWGFLAACIELVHYQSTGEWRIPVGIDATNSGTQFLAAIARDESVSEDVNISNCTYAPVGDIYQKAGNAILERIIAEDKLDKFPSLQGLSVGDKQLRKLIKRSCMTYGYSCGATTMGKHTFSDRKDHGYQPFTDMAFGEAAELGQEMYSAIQSILPRVAAIMKAMQDCFVGYKGSPTVCWTTPVGFRAFQHKPTMKKERVILEFDKRDRIDAVVYEETTKASIKEHQLGCIANGVHSLDAALMIKTINAMGDCGVTDFHGVHDQFGVHPGHVDLLGQQARTAFYSIIKDDPIEGMMNEAVGGYKAPEKGDWDPSNVLNSRYFLC